jgi:hypothetical protein
MAEVTDVHVATEGATRDLEAAKVAYKTGDADASKAAHATKSLLEVHTRTHTYTHTHTFTRTHTHTHTSTQAYKYTYIHTFSRWSMLESNTEGQDQSILRALYSAA